MTHKVCPVCGSVAEVMMGIARCGNQDCFICDFGFHVEQWDAPRPLEEKMKADIEILRAEIDDLRDSLRNERIFSSKWLHERDAARAELETLKLCISELEKQRVCHYPDTSDPCAWTCMDIENSDIVIRFDEENISDEDRETGERMENLIGCMFDVDELVYLQPYDEVISERDAARAELEAYKARRCGNCRLGWEDDNGLFCLSNKPYIGYMYTIPEKCCWAWEAIEEEVK